MSLCNCVLFWNFYFHFEGHTSELDASHSFSGTTKSIGLIGTAFYNGLWAYDGW